jgi:hypothetical protein
MSLQIEIGANVSEANARLTKFYADLRKNLNEVNTTVKKTSDTFQKSTDKMTEAANSFGKSSRNSLTALSLTLQDLPFGFIGIQNNLPGIIQGFGQMSAEAKNGASVMTQLKTALLGPAGLYLAFSAISAIVTKLSMEYGGLGNAIDALFGKVNPLAKVIKDAGKSQEDFNESFKTSGQIIASATGSVDAQILKVKLLSDTVKNLSNSEELRKNALYELQKIDKAYFGQITTAIGDVGKLEEATRKYTDAILANAIAKAYEAKLTEAAINLEEQRNALKDLAPAYAEATKKQKEFLESYADAYDPVTGAKILQPGFIANADIVAFNKQKLVVDAAVITLDKLKESFSNATLEATKFVEPVEKVAKAVKKIKVPKELDLEELSRKARYAANKLQEQADKNRLNYLQEQLKLEEKITKETFAQADKDMKADAEAFSKVNFKKLSEFTKPLDELQKSFEATKIFLQDIFFNPLQDLFQNFLDTGKFTFKEFGKVVLDNLKRIVAQIAAQQVIQLLAQVLNPLGALASTGVLTNPAANAGRGQRGILSALSNIFIGRVANPNFGGVDGGTMGMTGSVNLVLRGTDLVGAINRTNSQISRVG